MKHQRESHWVSVWWCVLSSCWKYPSVGSNLCSESSPASPSRTQPSPLARKVWRIPAGVVWGLQGNGKCWFILKLFASLCIQLQSRRDVYHSLASQPATDYEEISNKTLWFPNHQHCQLQLLVLMNKNLMSDTTDIFKMWRRVASRSTELGCYRAQWIVSNITFRSHQLRGKKRSWYLVVSNLSLVGLVQETDKILTWHR